MEVFLLLAAARPVSEIAERLALSVKTVSTYRTRILEKMSLASNAEIIQHARNGNREAPGTRGTARDWNRVTKLSALANS